MSGLLILKTLHIGFMVSWFAGIFYLPRLFVYHADTDASEVHEQFIIMERRLLYFVTPFALFTLLSGLGMIYLYGREWFAASMWLHIKLTCVIALFIYHGYCFKLLADFREGRNKQTSRFYRIFNEFPVILLFVIIALAVIKPSI